MVPKIIHQIIGAKASPQIAKCLASWYKLFHYGFKIKIWDDAAIIKFIDENYSFALRAFTEARNYAERADIARYLIIYHYGGYYMDWDVEMLDAELFSEVCQTHTHGFLVQDPENKTLASEAFSACRNEPYLMKLVENIIDVFEFGYRDSLTTPQYSGPHRMREAYYFFKRNSAQQIIDINDIFLYNYDDIRRRPERTKPKALIHYWNHEWGC